MMKVLYMADYKYTPNQEKFAQLIASGVGSSDAYRQVYSTKNMKPNTIHRKAHLLTHMDKIRARVVELSAPAIEKLQITNEYILSTIVDTIERCKQARPVLDKKGNPVFVETPNGDISPAYYFDPKAILSGANLLAKYKGLYEKDNAQKNPIQMSLDDLPADVLDMVIERLTKLSHGSTRVSGQSDARPVQRITH